MEALIGNNPFGLCVSPTPSIELLVGLPPVVLWPTSLVASIPLPPIVPEHPSLVLPPICTIIAHHAELSTWYNILVWALHSTPQGTALASAVGLSIYDGLEDW